MKKQQILYILLILFIPAMAFTAEQIDINNAEDVQIAELQVSDELITAILDYRFTYGDFESIYDLMKVPGMDMANFLKIKNQIAVYPEYLSHGQQNLEDNYYKFEQMAFSDGSSEGLVDMWMELLSNPRNINEMDYHDLVNLPGMTLKDVKAVMKYMSSGNNVTTKRDLRNIEGLSHYAYSNLSDFVRYDNQSEKKWTGQYSFIVRNSLMTIIPDDDPEAMNLFQSNQAPLDVYHKLRIRTENDIETGLTYSRSMGEDDEYYSLGSIDIPRVKGYISKQFQKNKDWGVRSIILGHYIATFGQGVVMENTGYSTPRKNGYGFRKRLTGIQGDLGRNINYTMRGAAAEFYAGDLLITPFFSTERRDAVINSDSSFTALIRMSPRFSYGLTGELNDPMQRSVQEVLYGVNIRYVYKNTAHIGFTSYESLYDRVLDPQIETVVAPENLSKYLYSIGNSADSEIEAMYGSHGESGFWSHAKSFRRVLGVDASWVIDNITVRGEAGALDADGNGSIDDTDPKALVLDAYMQWEALNFFVLYRKYDVDFDNPYQRSFSNYVRYKSSIFEDSYYLEDVAYAFLYSGSVQPQAEEGFYYSFRYQIHRQLILQAEHDIWTRVSDQSRYNRLVLRADYRPVFQYRIKLRQKFQSRSAENAYSPTGYTSNETRIDVQARMSRFNSFNILFAYGFTAFDPRARLTDNIAGGNSLVGNAGSPGRAIAAKFTHNFNKRLKIISQFMIYDGFIWNFEDTDFRIYNSLTEAYHGYITLYSRLNRNLSIRMKYSFDEHMTLDNIVDGVVTTEEGTYTLDPVAYPKSSSDFRIQLDYHF